MTPDCYRYLFDSTVERLPRFPLVQHVFVHRPPGQMPESEHMANYPLTKQLWKAVEPFKVISVTPDTIPVNETRIHHTVSEDRAMLIPGKCKPDD